MCIADNQKYTSERYKMSSFELVLLLMELTSLLQRTQSMSQNNVSCVWGEDQCPDGYFCDPENSKCISCKVTCAHAVSLWECKTYCRETYLLQTTTKSITPEPQPTTEGLSNAVIIPLIIFLTTLVGSIVLVIVCCACCYNGWQVGQVGYSLPEGQITTKKYRVLNKTEQSRRKNSDQKEISKSIVLRETNLSFEKKKPEVVVE